MTGCAPDLKEEFNASIKRVKTKYFVYEFLWVLLIVNRKQASSKTNNKNNNKAAPFNRAVLQGRGINWSSLISIKFCLS